MIACPGCGAGLRFDIPSQKMKCEYCGEFLDPDLFRIPDSKENRAPYYDAYAFDCPSCGAELITADKTDATGFCPYCGNTAILFDRLRKVKMPAYIIPFQVTKDDCKKAYRRAARKAVFTPARYKRPELIDSFRGIYMPYWSYRTHHEGQAKIRAQGKTSVHNGYAITPMYDITGNVDTDCDAYAHDASRAFDDELSECLYPFDAKDRREFSPAYLSGFYADIADEDADRYREDALRDCSLHVAEQLLQDSGVTSVSSKKDLKPQSAATIDVPGEITGVEQVLYPVWFMSYREKNRITYATVNGQTGKVVADFPISPARFLAATLILAGLLFLLLNTVFTLKPEWALLITSLLMILGVWLSGRSFSPDTVRPKIELTGSLGSAVLMIASPLFFTLFGLLILYFGRKSGLTGAVFLIIGLFSLTAAIKKAFKLEKPDQGDRYRAFRIPGWEIAAAVVMFCAALLIFFLRPVYNLWYYIPCLIEALFLFFAIYQSFRYHRSLAMRQPPQFHKKGGEDNA